MNKVRSFLQKRASFALCLILLLGAGIPVRAFAAEEKVIRVGSPENIYNDENAQGERTGYGYEYLQKIANYTGWKYEYVPCTWNNCFEKLQSGEIDILEAISFTEERAETMAFSSMPMSEEKYYIFAKLADTDISLADLSSFNHKNIGVLKDHLPEAVLNEWTRTNGLRMNYLNITSKENVIERLNRQEIDCFVSVEGTFWSEYGIAPVTTIGSSGIYFAFRKDSAGLELKKSVDGAMLRISEEYPFFTNDLYRRFFSDTKIPVLTKEERDWLVKHGAIRVGFLKNDGGISSLHPDTGILTGVISDYIDLAKNCLYGQTLDFEPMGYDSRHEMVEALQGGEIDMIFYVAQNPNSAERQGYDLSDTTWTTNMAAITTRDIFDETAENRVAVVSGNSALKSYVSRNYPKWTLAEYETQKDAVRAVARGEADCFVVDSGDSAGYPEDSRFYSFVLSKPNNASFAVEHGNITLLSILNKTLETISSSKLSGLLDIHNNALKKVTLLDFFRDNLPVVSAIITLVFLVTLALLRKSMAAEEKARQAQKQAEEANESKTRFLSNMSHDIRTPINGIIGMLNILKRKKDDPERVADCIQKIDSSSKLLLSLINDVLDMAKLESNAAIIQNESVNLSQLCGEVVSAVNFQAEAAGITLTQEHDNYDGLYVFTSSVHLKKILMNLFTNAVKYNKPNGSIHTSMRTVERTDKTLVCEFKIADTGIGMSEDFVRDQLFQPFVQADTSARSSYTGTGLGMSIVQEIVRKMGGTIAVESKLGVGTTYTVVLPFTIDPQGKFKVQEELTDRSIAGMRFLLVEDNALNAEIAEELLKDEQATVVTAENGKIGADLFRQSPAGTFDAILMDVMMPVMDGLTATREIRALERPDAKTIPIIAMTANAFAEDAQKCMDAGMNAHIAKPLDIRTAERVICGCVRSVEKG